MKRTILKFLAPALIIGAALLLVSGCRSPFSSLFYPQNTYGQVDTNFGGEGGDTTGGDTTQGGDTLEDNPNVTTPSDVSGMFNERGFSTSNSFSSDENEIINDFNGNLQYSIPMFNMKGPGDIQISLSLNYNGSVGYQVFPSIQPTLGGSLLPRQNYTAPGWIFSLNGMAVQMLDFETDFMTHPQTDSSTSVSGNNVKMLATGYHISDRLAIANNENPDQIMIMRGDGSVLTLNNYSAYCNDTTNGGEDCYQGVYYSENKNDYTKAVVEFIEDEPFPYYRNRRVSVMNGDGLTYVYEEEYNRYSDIINGYTSNPFKPQALILKQIKDKVGHVIFLHYKSSYSDITGPHNIYGRPVISSIEGLWTGGTIGFTYNTYNNNSSIGISGPGGMFRVLSDFSFDSSENHRGNVTKVFTPTNDEMTIENESYVRTASNVRNPYVPNGTMSVSPSLKRIKSVTNFNGGKRTYTYAGSNSLSLNMIPFGDESVHSSWANYKGQGRDLFFANMISEKITSSGENDTRKEEFTYEYIPGRDTSQVWLQPVSDTDQYFTTKKITSLDSSNNNNTPAVSYTKKEYRNFRLFSHHYRPENPDFQGHTKIINEKYYSDNENNLKKEIAYDFIKNTGGQNGSYLDTLITERYNNSVEKKTRFAYTHRSGLFPFVGYFDQPLEKKTEYDSKGRKTETYFKTLSGTDIHYLYGLYRPYVNDEQAYDTTEMYFNGLIDSVIITSPGNQRLYKEATEYITTNGSEGYMGQLKNKKIYDGAGTNYKLLQYNYSKNDTSGIYLYTIHGSLPNNEGNLKFTIDPMGNKTEFFYRITDTTGNSNGNTDQYSQPGIKYFIANGNGTIDDHTEIWYENRFPAITKTYSDANHYLLSYKKYDEMGNVIKEFGPNRYLSEYSYGVYGRLDSATLPYDFNTNSRDTMIIDTTSFPVEYIIPTTKWGWYDASQTGNWIRGSTYNLSDNNPTSSILRRVIAGGPPTSNPGDIVHLPLMTFGEDTTLLHLSSLDYATFIFFPDNLTSQINTDTSLGILNFELKPVSGINETESGGTITMNFQTGGGWNSSPVTYPRPYVACDPSPTGQYEMINSFYRSEKDLDVTEMIKNLIENQTPLAGMVMDISQNLSNLNPSEDIWMGIDECTPPNSGWSRYFEPRIKIKGIYTRIDTSYMRVHNGGTLVYDYNDTNNMVTVFSKIDQTHSKKTEHLFDGFYRLKETRLFTDASNYNSFKTEYNYLDQKARTIDAMGDSSKFSYDEWGELSRTDNADNSHTLDSVSFMDTLITSIDTVTGFVKRVTFRDEVGNKFEKFFDAVGNLVREQKFIMAVPPENPLASPVETPLATDYKYDAMYRVIKVHTPQGKEITYGYDGFGRQVSRITADAGLEKFWYDNNDNLVYSQDAKQKAIANNIYTERQYDGMNRLTIMGETALNGGSRPFDSLMTEDSLAMTDFNGTDDYLIVNVYDTLSTAPGGMTFTAPAGYTSAANNTKGQLVSTAFRTNRGDQWNFKFYRYDARGRVIKMWQKLDGMDSVKTVEYAYNSSNQQVALNYQDGRNDNQKFSYGYDLAGRLDNVKYYHPIGIPTDGPGDYAALTSYHYNANSQVDTNRLTAAGYNNYFEYNKRGWLKRIGPTAPIFYEGLSYFANGNVDTMRTAGTYNDNMANNTNAMVWTHTYDASNRLTKQNFSADSTYDVANTYDKDGNILTLKRFGANNNIVDNLDYDYYSGKNRLKSVTNRGIDYAYDSSGNVTKDVPNDISYLKYDHRNLLTEWGKTIGDSSFATRYYYDEAGNRIRKALLIRTIDDPNPVDWNWLDSIPTFDPEEKIAEGTPTIDGPGDSPDQFRGWRLIRNEYYIRGIDGKELAVYNGNIIDQWNIWGADNVGKIEDDGNLFFYLKDHLGSVRATIDTARTVVSAQDYDMWGHALENRTYNADQSKYDFTSKERDLETNYDYFGARYYDSRIGRWGGVEPLMEKYVSQTPYVYSGNNPIVFVDSKGMDWYFYLEGKRKDEAVIEKKDGPDRYFFQHEKGNKIVTHGKDDKREFLNYSYFEANTKTTVDLYFENNSEYKASSVIADWEKNGFVERFEASLPESGDTRSSFKYALQESNKGKMDQKYNMSPSSLYIFEGTAYNQQEAGNIVWGATMNYLGNNKLMTMIYAHAGEMLIDQRLDETNEQIALQVGWQHFEDKMEKQYGKR